MTSPKVTQDQFEKLSYDEAAILFHTVKQKPSPAKAWLKERKNMTTVTVTGFEGSQGVYFVVIEKTDEAYSFFTTAQGNEDVNAFFSVSLPSGTVFFQAEAKGGKGKDLYFKVVKDFYRIQRRSAIRIPLSASEDFSFDFCRRREDVDPVPARMKDLSIGGCSILLDRTTAQDHGLSEGAIIEHLRFKIHHHTIETTGQVRHLTSMNNSKLNPTLKIGIQFGEMKNSDQRVLSAYLNEEALKYFGRFQ